MEINSSINRIRFKNKGCIFALIACSLFTLNSCSNINGNKEEITKKDAIEMAKNESSFKSSKFNFFKFSSTWTKSEATDGSAKFVKEAYDAAYDIQVGKKETETSEVNFIFPYICTKETIENLKDEVDFYKNGNKLSFSFTVTANTSNFLNTNLSVIEKNSYTYSYNEEGYLVSFIDSLTATCNDGSTYTALQDVSVEWVE